jgi:type I restriction enzyme, S subunit
LGNNIALKDFLYFLLQWPKLGNTHLCRLSDCLVEIRTGVGADWSKYPVLGATRNGLAPAKEGVGKAPERYKPIDPVTVFYNPMRILLGSIAMVDEGDATGITSPDYVVVKGRPGILDTRWFLLLVQVTGRSTLDRYTFARRGT